MTEVIEKQRSGRKITSYGVFKSEKEILITTLSSHAFLSLPLSLHTLLHPNLFLQDKKYRVAVLRKWSSRSPHSSHNKAEVRKPVACFNDVMLPFLCQSPFPKPYAYELVERWRLCLNYCDKTSNSQGGQETIHALTHKGICLELIRQDCSKAQGVVILTAATFNFFIS